MTILFVANDYFPPANYISDKFYIKITSILRIVARVCLLAGFVHDAIFKCFNWSITVNFYGETLKIGYYLAGIVIFINITGNLAASYMVLLQKKVLYACGFLTYVVVIEMVTLTMAFKFNAVLVLRACSVLGSIIMLLAESLGDSQLPGGSPDEDRRRSFLQLSGRCLLVLMFLSHLQSLSRPSDAVSPPLVVLEVVASTLMVLVTLGYRTRFNALALAVFLASFNVIRHDWWNVSQEMVSYVRYDFFQSWTVVGGLLIVVILGPGGISVDEAKKLM